MKWWDWVRIPWSCINEGDKHSEENIKWLKGTWTAYGGKKMSDRKINTVMRVGLVEKLYLTKKWKEIREPTTWIPGENIWGRENTQVNALLKDEDYLACWRSNNNISVAKTGSQSKSIGKACLRSSRKPDHGRIMVFTLTQGATWNWTEICMLKWTKL